MYLDDKKSDLIKKLKEVCGDGKFKLVSVKDLTGEDYTQENLFRDVRFLSESEYVDLRYCDCDELCLRLTAKGMSYEDSAEDSLENTDACDQKEQFYYAFMGAFCGGAVVTLLFLFVMFIVKYAVK